MKDVWVDVCSEVQPDGLRIGQGSMLAIQMLEKDSGTRYARLVARTADHESHTVVMEQEVSEL